MAISPLARPQTCVQASDQSDEVWRVNPRFVNYEISSHGRVRRLTTVTCAKAGTILKSARHYGGYRHHGLSVDGIVKTVRLNRLVCETFHGSPPSDQHVAAHNDSNTDNNRADNLRWATQQENEDDKTRAGRRPRMSRFGWSSLTADDVRAIRASSDTDIFLAVHYGVVVSTIRNVRSKKTWKHIV